MQEWLGFRIEWGGIPSQWRSGAAEEVRIQKPEASTGPTDARTAF